MKLKPKRNRGFVFLCLFFILFFAQIATATRTPFNDEFCNYEEFPASLNSISYLGFNGEFHIQGQYFFDLSQQETTTYFDLNQESVFRIYVTSDKVDVDLWVYDDTNGGAVADSLGIGKEEDILVTLPAGSYRIQFNFFGTFSPRQCEPLLVELAISPKATVLQRTSSFSCPSSEQFPSPNLSPLESGDPVDYNSDVNQPGIVMNAQSNASSNIDEIRWISQWPFFLQDMKQSGSYWRMEVSIGYDFLTGGSLGLMISQSPDEDISCVLAGNCTVAVHRKINENVARVVLEPGDYLLWLFEFVGEKDASLSSCTPFTLKLSVKLESSPENFVNCEAPALPDNLIPGLYPNPEGYLYYREHPLLQLSEGEHDMPFSLRQNSFFRCYVSPHRVDIDLKITNLETLQIVDYAFSWGGDELLVSYLPPGDYNFTVIYFGRYEPRFCETFEIEIAIAPVNNFTSNFSYCYDSNNNVLNTFPDLSNLQRSLDDPGHNFTFPLSTYYYSFNSSYRERTIQLTNFSLSVPSVIHLQLGDNFLMSDMEIYLYTYVGNETGTFHGYHLRNFEVLNTQLESGSYGLGIATGPSHKNLLPNYPPCGVYTLEFYIVPLVNADPCWEHFRAPRTLNSPPYLGNSGVMHINQHWLVPFRRGQWTTSETISINVPVTSIFRVWTEPHVVDIDFYLYISGNPTPIDSTILFNQEEELIDILYANQTYNLQIVYYHWASHNGHSNDPNCFTYNIELAISPLPAVVITDPCDPYLPNVTTIPNYDPQNYQPFYIKDTFNYMQTADGLSVQLPFSVTTDLIYFRAAVTYDFVWSDISLRLWVNNETAVYSKNEYNKHDFETMLLGPGNYSLEIYEPAIMEIPHYRQCVEFTLEIGYESSSNPSDDPTTILGCHHDMFPPSLSSIPFISPLSGNRTYISRKFLVNVDDRQDGFEFNLTTRSILTMFVPMLTSVDVDIYLYNGTFANPGSVLESKNGFAEEALYDVLAPGPYFIRTRYYGFRGSSLPPASQCLSFPAEISIAPVTYLESIPSLAQSCSTTYPPTILQPDSSSGAELLQNITLTGLSSSNKLSTRVQFTINADAAYLYFELGSYFASRGLSLDMSGSVDEGLPTLVQKTYYPILGYNTQVFNKLLLRGNYTITIHDPNPVNSMEQHLSCSPYAIAYEFNTTSVPSDYCDETEVLPTDLFSDAGGSQPYGGPQATDGSIRLYGEHFLLDIANRRDNFILFDAPVDCFMRVYARSDPSTDLDFFIYNNASRPAGSMIFYSLSTNVYESALVRLPNQTDPYLLDVYIFRMSQHNTCPTFYFETAIKPVEVVEDELACPVTLPDPEVPETSYDFSGGYAWEWGDFIFTNTRIQGNTVGGIFTYRITLTNVLRNATLFVFLGYDFLANDFQLTLTNADTDEVVALGEPVGSDDRDMLYNFYNTLFADMTVPGTYYLDISEDLSNKNLGMNQYCHKFTFFMSGFMDTLPYIQYVEPAHGSNLNPHEPLVVTIYFSEPVQSFNTTFSLATYLQNQNIVYLYPVSSPATHLFPSAAHFDVSYMTLEVTFPANFQQGLSYILYIDTTKFQSQTGVTFDNSSSVWTYSMTDCSCSGHGHCDNTYQCVCNLGYTGYQCSICDDGYHAAGGDCVRNDRCTPYTCNLHGVCNDSIGTLQCFCDTGYATSGNDFCIVCAPGYTGYPNCTSIGEAQERPNRCTAPLIPSSLDTEAYLGYNHAMHIQGNYYIDTDNLKHETTFTLYDNSLLRLYVEPHWIDVDLWLYSLKDDGTIDRLIDNGIAIYREEVIFRTLNGSAGAHPNKYLMRFRYYIWDHFRTASCETFNLEWSIVPLTRAITEGTQLSALCDSSDNLPHFNITFDPLPSTDYSYAPNTTFTLLRTNHQTPKYFYHTNFYVHPPAGTIANLYVELGYRFLPNQLALLLESGTNQNHCNQNGGAGDNCVNGDNNVNRNVLNLRLEEGSYSLWIYEPEPQNSAVTSCAVFTFSMSLSYTNVRDDLFFCGAGTFPSMLNAPGYLDFTGELHIEEAFLLSSQPAFFQLTQQSFLRIHGGSLDYVWFSILDFNNNNRTIANSTAGQRTQLFATLPAGSYLLQIGSSIISASSCPNVYVEFIIARDEPLINNCPGAEYLPDLPNLQVPYSFGQTSEEFRVPTPFFAYTNNRVIREYTFTVDEVSTIQVALSSNFLTAALGLELTSADPTMDTVNGIYWFNRNWMSEAMDPGTYTLSIVLPSANPPIPPANFPPCAEFTFELALTANGQADHCAMRGESIPMDLNTIRYLGVDNEFDYQSSSFRVPPFDGFGYSYITFTVPEDSLFRIYTEPHIVDIDLVLYDADNDSTSLADGGFSFNDEEEIVYLIKGGVNYEAQLLFWQWDNYPPCQTFGMEIAIHSIVQLPQRCPRPSDHWPPTITNTNLPTGGYYYNSIDTGEDLHFQQATDSTKTSPYYAIHLTSSADIYAKVGYDFVSGHLAMRLESETDSENIYYGANSLNGNVLDLVDVPSGDYNLILYEVASNVIESAGCSNFSFEISIQPPAANPTVLYDHLPSTLDTLSYMATSGRTHLTNSYAMFDQGNTEWVTFTVPEQSLLRISTDHQQSVSQQIQIVLLDGNNRTYAAHLENLLELIPADHYTAKFNKPIGVVNSTVLVNLEFAVAPKSAILNDISSYFNQPPDCADSNIAPIVIPATGYYQYNEPHLYVSQQTMSSSLSIQTLTLHLDNDSVLYSQVSFNFLLSEFELSITGTTADTNENVALFGRNGRNLNEINQILPAGHYQLSLKQPITFDFMSTFPHCTEYSWTIIIEPVNQETTHVDCSSLDVVPWDLNNPDGGSEPYGGPLDNTGSLHMWGSNFLMPDTRSTDDMQLRIRKTSIMSIVSEEAYIGDISYLVTPLSNDVVTNRTAVVTNIKQRAELFVLQHSGLFREENFTITLLYNTPRRISCPYFGLQMIISPLENVQNSVICPMNSVLPRNQVATNIYGVYTEYLESYFTGAQINQYTNVSQGVSTFRYEINVTINKTSTVIASLSYNALVSLFNLQILTITRNGNRIQSGAGEWSMEKMTAGATNINQQVSSTLQAGRYIFVIKQPTYQLPFTTLASNYCVPFIWNLQISPTTGLPYVSQVTPAGGDGLYPLQPLVIEIIFSEAVYDSQGQFLSSSNSYPIKNSFYLQQINSTRTIPVLSVTPTSFTSSKFWQLTFPSGNFPSKATFQLQMIQGNIKNQVGDDVQYFSNNFYRMIDMTCSGRGQVDQGYCFCDSGYAGRECEVCNIGYVNVFPNGSNPVCKLRTGNYCLEDSCGCDPRVTDSCVKLGVCDDSNGTIVCYCNSPYSGAHCQQCAAGYSDYSQGCIKDKQCPVCAHGTCNNETATCNCDPHYTGASCDECQLGWSGTNCQHSSPVASSATTGKIELGVAVLRWIILVFAFILIFGTIGFIVYKRYIRPKPYARLDTSELDEFNNGHEKDDFLDEDVEAPKSKDSPKLVALNDDD